jgi:hypothetical protein
MCSAQDTTRPGLFVFGRHEDGTRAAIANWARRRLAIQPLWSWLAGVSCACRQVCFFVMPPGPDEERHDVEGPRAPLRPYAVGENAARHALDHLSHRLASLVVSRR